jgi:hypothetical protein
VQHPKRKAAADSVNQRLQIFLFQTEDGQGQPQVCARERGDLARQFVLESLEIHLIALNWKRRAFSKVCSKARCFPEDGKYLRRSTNLLYCRPDEGDHIIRVERDSVRDPQRLQEAVGLRFGKNRAQNIHSQNENHRQDWISLTHASTMLDWAARLTVD